MQGVHWLLSNPLSSHLSFFKANPFPPYSSNSLCCSSFPFLLLTWAVTALTHTLGVAGREPSRVPACSFVWWLEVSPPFFFLPIFSIISLIFSSPSLLFFLPSLSMVELTNIRSSTQVQPVFHSNSSICHLFCNLAVVINF